MAGNERKQQSAAESSRREQEAVLATPGAVQAGWGGILAASGAVLAASKLRKIKIHLGDLVIQALLLQTFEGGRSNTRKTLSP